MNQKKAKGIRKVARELAAISKNPISVDKLYRQMKKTYKPNKN